MNQDHKITRNELVAKLAIGYQTLLRYENEYEWLAPGKTIKGAGRTVFYQKEDVKKLLQMLLSLDKIEIKADRKWIKEILD